MKTPARRDPSASSLHIPSATRESRSLFAAFLILTASFGAAPGQTSNPTAAPPRPRVVLPSGAAYRVELARTPDEHAQGLMFRESLPPESGMLFLFPDVTVRKFWMKNTMIPLDMIWMDSQGKVLFVSADTPPCKADPCPSYGPEGPAANVVEIAGGMAKKEKVVVGSVLGFVDIK